MAIGNFGVIGTKHIDVNPIIDEAYLKGLQTASGLELSELITRTDAAMSALNEGVPDVVAPYLFFTDNPESQPRRVGRKFVQLGGEYTTARPQKISETSFMYAIRKYEISTGFTEDGLHDITLSGFDNELNAVVDAWQSLYLGEALLAWFSPVLVPVRKGSAILAPKLAGSGTGEYAFTGTYPNGAALPGGYTHYYRIAEADLATALKSQADRLSKWHRAPFDLIGSVSAVEKISALPEFTPAIETGINAGAGERTAALDPDVYAGQLPGRIRVKHGVDALGTTDHYSIAKAYGAGDPRNFLAWLYDAKWVRDAYVRAKNDYPLAESTVIQRLGINIADRAGAIVVQIAAAGEYTPPSITF